MLFKLNKCTRFLPGVFFLFTLALLQGCAYAPQVANLEKQALDIKAHTELVEVPFYPQTEYQCGPAALATVLNYRQQKTTPLELVHKVYVPNRQGSFQVEMIAATRQFALVPYKLAPSIKDLLLELEAGNPVLILQNLGLDSYPIWHFAVVVGYDLKKSKVVLRSATEKRWQTSLKNFEQTWRKTNYWGLVIVKPSQIAKTANPYKWLSSIYDLEKVGQHLAATKGYKAAVQAWPEYPQAWMALTNFLYNQKKYDDALKAYKRALSLNSDSPQLWNNFSYALKAKGCLQAANAAAACALKLKPDDVNIQATKKEMQQALSSRVLNVGSAKCDIPACY